MTRAPAPSPRRGGVPQEFVDQLSDMGLIISHVGITHTLVDIEAGSPRWFKFVDMLHELPPTHVDLWLTLSGPEDVYNEPDSPDSNYIMEFVRYLPTLSPGCSLDMNQHVSGDARTIIKAVVRAVQDPPACCPAAQAVPSGHYMTNLEIEFSNLLMEVSIHKMTTKGEGVKSESEHDIV